jgi:hypothetical protein
MSIDAQISVVYNASVKVPASLHEQYGHLPAYEQHSYAAGRLVEASGSYDDGLYVIEWGEAPDRAQCEAFIASWTTYLESLP